MSSSRRGGVFSARKVPKKITILQRDGALFGRGEGLAVEAWFGREEGTSPLKHGWTEGGGMLAGGGSGMHGQREDPRRVGSFRQYPLTFTVRPLASFRMCLGT